MGKDSASLFAGIRRSSCWSLLEDSGETSFSNRNLAFRFEEEEPPSDTEFSQYYGSAETERATCAPTRFPLAVSFPHFFSAKRNGVAPQREKPSSCSRPRRSGLASPGGSWREATDEGNPRRSGQSSGPLRIRPLSLQFIPMSRRLRRASFFARPKKEAKEMRQREPIPKAVPFGILTHRPGGCGPLEIPRGLRGRRTRDGDYERREFFLYGQSSALGGMKSASAGVKPVS